MTDNISLRCFEKKEVWKNILVDVPRGMVIRKASFELIGSHEGSPKMDMRDRQPYT